MHLAWPEIFGPKNAFGTELGQLKPLSWYQIKKDSQDRLKYVIQHVLCYAVLIQSHTPGFQIEIYNSEPIT